MALGELKGGSFEIVYRAKGTGTLANGDIVAFDSDGDVIPATAATLGKHGILTPLTHVVGATTYYGVCMRGRCVTEAGAAIKPNKFVESNAAAEAVVADQVPDTTYDKANLDEILRVVGRYVRVETTDNQYAASDAADGDLIIVEVGDRP